MLECYHCKVEILRRDWLTRPWASYIKPRLRSFEKFEVTDTGFGQMLIKYPWILSTSFLEHLAKICSFFNEKKVPRFASWQAIKRWMLIVRELSKPDIKSMLFGRVIATIHQLLFRKPWEFLQVLMGEDAIARTLRRCPELFAKSIIQTLAYGIHRSNLSYHSTTRDTDLVFSIFSGSSRVRLRSSRVSVDRLESIIFSSSWMRQKRRKHYQSIYRTDAMISAQELVYVLVGEQWFIQIDEAFMAPHQFSIQRLMRDTWAKQQTQCYCPLDALDYLLLEVTNITVGAQFKNPQRHLSRPPFTNLAWRAGNSSFKSDAKVENTLVRSLTLHVDTLHRLLAFHLEDKVFSNPRELIQTSYAEAQPTVDPYRQARTHRARVLPKYLQDYI